MRMPTIITALAFAAVPVAGQAQLFWQPPSVASPPLTGAEPQSGVNLPGATPAELQAGLLWSLRAALNVAALQCDFEPTIQSTSNYNAMLAKHKDELTAAFKIVSDYFIRIHGTVAGQKMFDQYGTRTYSAYSTVQAQRNFCQAAGIVGREAIFAPRGALFKVAQMKLGELRNALVAQSDLVYGNPAYGFVASLPPLDDKCWQGGVMTVKCARSWKR